MSNWHQPLFAALADLHGWGQPIAGEPATAELDDLRGCDPTLFDNMVTLARALPAGRTLDVGGGSGVGAAILSSLGHEVTTLDASPSACWGSIPARWKVVVVTGDAEDLPFADEAFDNVFCHHTLEHVPAPLFALCECNRVTRPGGMIALGVPPPAVNTASSSHLSDFSAAQLSYLLAVAGYRVGDFSQRSYDLRVTGDKCGFPFDLGANLRDLRGRTPAEFQREAQGAHILCDEYRAPGNLERVALDWGTP